MRDEPRVLIVDDQEGARITLECILEDAGYVVETADSGQDALQKAEQQAFDAALLDVRLPDMAGTEVLERLKRLCPECVVIMVTGHASVETAVSAVDHGASAYIRKPIDADHLLAKLSDELEKQSLISENKRMVRTLSLLYSVNTALSQSLDMETTLADALAVALDGWGADAGAIWVREEGNGDWTLTVHRGLPARIVQDGARPTTSDGEPVSEPA
ncbi:MAG: response regulator [Armatimonadota bacterium]